MTTLLLLDLDAVLIAWRRARPAALPMPRLLGAGEGGASPAWLESDDGTGEPVGAPEAPRTVVAIAVSGALADHFGLTYRYVRRFAARLATALMAPSPVRAEIALTQWAPGATLGALHRLCQESPDHASAIAVERIAVVCDDELFASRLPERLRASGPWRPVATDLALVTLFRRAPGARGPLIRVRRDPPPHAGSSGALPDPTWSARVDTRARADHARSRPIDLDPPDRELADAGRVAEWSYPSLYSQVGPTIFSLRGVARMASLPAEAPPPLGAIDPHDGLEVRAGPPPDLALLRPTVPCPLGPGAVSLQAGIERATLRTLLPEHTVVELVHKQGWAPGQGIWRGWLDDDDAIVAMLAFPHRYSPEVTVAFRASGTGVRADVEARLAGPPRAAWIRDGQPAATQRLDGWAPRLPRRQTKDGVLRADAAPARWSVLRDDLILVSPVPAGGGVVRVPARIGAGTLGHARWGAYEVALLVAAGTPPGSLHAVPIQAVDYRRARAAVGSWISPQQWSELQRLPIAVPAQTFGFAPPSPLMSAS